MRPCCIFNRKWPAVPEDLGRRRLLVGTRIVHIGYIIIKLLRKTEEVYEENKGFNRKRRGFLVWIGYVLRKLFRNKSGEFILEK
jgi:hypothetical protein